MATEKESGLNIDGIVECPTCCGDGVIPTPDPRWHTAPPTRTEEPEKHLSDSARANLARGLASHEAQKQASAYIRFLEAERERGIRINKERRVMLDGSRENTRNTMAERDRLRERIASGVCFDCGAKESAGHGDYCSVKHGAYPRRGEPR